MLQVLLVVGAAAGGILLGREILRRRRPLLDVHLPKDTEQAVVIASAKETNPENLHTFAGALLQQNREALFTEWLQNLLQQERVTFGKMRGQSQPAEETETEPTPAPAPSED